MDGGGGGDLRHSGRNLRHSDANLRHSQPNLRHSSGCSGISPLSHVTEKAGNNQSIPPIYQERLSTREGVFCVGRNSFFSFRASSFSFKASSFSFRRSSFSFDPPIFSFAINPCRPRQTCVTRARTCVTHTETCVTHAETRVTRPPPHPTPPRPSPPFTHPPAACYTLIRPIILQISRGEAVDGDFEGEPVVARGSGGGADGGAH